MENKWIQLSEGKFLLRDFSKYGSGLCLISEEPKVSWERVDPTDFNLPSGDLEALYGVFFISKKGTPCFEELPKEHASHILLMDKWGVGFSKYRGRTLPQDGLYYHRASSNGGGFGFDYAIFPIGWKQMVSIEDL